MQITLKSEESNPITKIFSKKGTNDDKESNKTIESSVKESTKNVNVICKVMLRRKLRLKQVWNSLHQVDDSKPSTNELGKLHTPDSSEEE